MKHKTDPHSFDRTVRELFAPIYPVIAGQIKTKTAITSGKCLDAGCGTGALGIALANITDLHVTFFDRQEAMLELAAKYAADNTLEGRSGFLRGDIHAIPLEDMSMDLVISRGSIPFWDDWAKAFSEILRVLKPGGKAYIGGGFGNAELRDEIAEKRKEKDPHRTKSFKERFNPERRSTLPGIVTALGPKDFEMIEDDSGFWAVVTK